MTTPWQAITKCAKADLAPATPGTFVTSDGLGCFAAVADAGCCQGPVVVGSPKPHDLPPFKWVNTVLGNLKTTLLPRRSWARKRAFEFPFLMAVPELIKAFATLS